MNTFVVTYFVCRAVLWALKVTGILLVLFFVSQVVKRVFQPTDENHPL